MKRKCKRLAAFFLAATMLALSFTSCGKQDEPATEQVTVAGADGQMISINQSSVFKLPYTRSDSLNPFFAETLNNQTLVSLLFEPLFRLDEQFTPQLALADSCTSDGETLRVALKSGLKFSDGSQVTAEDVAFSFRLAKNAPAYAANLAGVSSAAVQDSRNLIFTLTAPNINAEQLLTFPVAKSGSGQTAAENPVGSGRFVLKTADNGYQLTPNGFYAATPVITSIELMNVESQEEIRSALRIGKISFIYDDLSSGNQSAGHVKSEEVPLNNLVYLGFNPKNFIGTTPALRQAVSYAISREEIVSGTYHSYATAATSVFNPLWGGAKGANIASANADAKAAELALQGASYGGAQMVLLVNSENNYRRAAADMIAKQLNAVGLKVRVNALPFETYKSYIQSGYYDMFLGEVRLTDDMNLNCFFQKEGSCSFSLDLTASSTAVAYASYLSGVGNIGGFLMAFREEMPFVPVAYRKGIVSYSNQMKVKPASVYGDIFRNVEQWTF